MRRALVDMRPDRFEDLIALVALYRPGPMANIPTYCARKHGRGAGRIPPPEARADPEGDLRRHHLPGTGDADRAGPRRLSRSARPISCAAPWARRSAPRWRRSASASSPARSRSGVDRDRRGGDLRRLRQVRRLRLQQVALRALCADHLPDRLHEGELPGRVPRRVADAGDRQHRQDRRVPPRGDPPRHPGRAAVGQPLRRRVRRRRTGRILYALAAIKGVGAQAVEHLVEVRGEKPFRDLADFGRRINPQIINKRALESLVAAGALDELEPDRARVSRRRRPHPRHGGARPGQRRASARADCSAPPTTAEPLLLPAVEPWLAGGEAAARARRGRLLSLRPPARRIRAGPRRRCACRPGPSSPSRSAAAPPPAGSPAPSPRGRSGASAPATAWPSSSSPTRPAPTRRVLFSEGLTEYRDLLEPGRSVVVLVSAEERPEGINVRIQSVESLDKVMAGLKQIRVFLRDEAPLPSVAEASRRQGRGRGQPRPPARGGPARGRDAAARAATPSRRRSRARSAR